MSFRKTMINTILLLCRSICPLLIRSCSLKGESTYPSCCKGPAFFPPKHRYVRLIFLQWVSLGSVTSVFRDCQQNFFLRWSWCFSWLECKVLHPEKRHTTSSSNAGLFWASSSLLRSSSSAQRVVGGCSRGVKETGFSVTLRTSDTSGSCKEALKEDINLTYFGSTF